MVKEILEHFPVAIQDMNSENKNAVLLAVENRQPLVYKLLLDRKIQKETFFRMVDKEGNSALHLAAMFRENLPWHIPGAALQMQWEIKWFNVCRLFQSFISYSIRIATLILCICRPDFSM